MPIHYHCTHPDNHPVQQKGTYDPLSEKLRDLIKNKYFHFYGSKYPLKLDFKNYYFHEYHIAQLAKLLRSIECVSDSEFRSLKLGEKVWDAKVGENETIRSLWIKKRVNPDIFELVNRDQKWLRLYDELLDRLDDYLYGFNDDDYIFDTFLRYSMQIFISEMRCTHKKRAKLFRDSLQLKWEGQPAGYGALPSDKYKKIKEDVREEIALWSKKYLEISSYGGFFNKFDNFFDILADMDPSSTIDNFFLPMLQDHLAGKQNMDKREWKAFDRFLNGCDNATYRQRLRPAVDNEFSKVKAQFFVDVLLGPRELTDEGNAVVTSFFTKASSKDKENFLAIFKEKVTPNSKELNHYSAEFTQMLAAYLMAGTRLFKVEPQTTKESLYANKTVICAEIIAALAFFVQPHVASAGAITLLVNSLIGTKESHEDSYLKLLVKGLTGADELQEVAFAGIGEKITQIKRTLGVTVTDDRIESVNQIIPNEMKTEPLGIVISWLINKALHQLQSSAESALNNPYYQKIVISTHFRQCLLQGYFSTNQNNDTNDFIRNASFLTVIAAFGDFSPQNTSEKNFAMRNRRMRAIVKINEAPQEIVWQWGHGSTFNVKTSSTVPGQQKDFSVVVESMEPNGPVSEAAEWEVEYLKALLQGAQGKTIIPGVSTNLNVVGITLVGSAASQEANTNTFEDFKAWYDQLPAKELEPLPTQKRYSPLQAQLEDHTRRLTALEEQLRALGLPSHSDAEAWRKEYEMAVAPFNEFKQTLETMASPEFLDLLKEMPGLHEGVQGLTTKANQLCALERRISYLEEQAKKTQQQYEGSDLICLRSEDLGVEKQKEAAKEEVLAGTAVVIIVEGEGDNAEYRVGFQRKDNGKYEESRDPLPKADPTDKVRNEMITDAIKELKAHIKTYQSKPEKFNLAIARLLDEHITENGGVFNPGKTNAQGIRYEAKFIDQQKQLDDQETRLKKLEGKNNTASPAATETSASSTNHANNPTTVWGERRGLLAPDNHGGTPTPMLRGTAP